MIIHGDKSSDASSLLASTNHIYSYESFQSFYEFISIQTIPNLRSACSKSSASTNHMSGPSITAHTIKYVWTKCLHKSSIYDMQDDMLYTSSLFLHHPASIIHQQASLHLLISLTRHTSGTWATQQCRFAHSSSQIYQLSWP